MPKALILSDGKPGHENQSKALAEGLGLAYDLVPCVFPTRALKALSYLFDRLGLLRRDLTGAAQTATEVVQRSGERPALLIGTGSNTFYTLKLLSRRLGIPCAAILTPGGYRLGGFGVILAPEFDTPPAARNVIRIPTNLTPARPDFYRTQTAAFLERHVPKRDRAVGVIVGGKNPIADVSPEWLRLQLEAIFAATPECEHWVTTSRRTSPEAESVVDAFPFDYKLLFSRDRFNPIPAFVTQCERLFVTADSTGMLSEAVAVGGAAVEILDNLTVSTGKFARFVDNLCDEGYAHRFDGTLGDTRRKVDLAPVFGEVKRRLGL